MMRYKRAEVYTAFRNGRKIIMEDRFVYCNEGSCAVDPKDLELRYNHNHDEKGRFSSGSGGGAVKKSVDKSGKSGIIDNKECYIHPDKINKFFLKPGAKHSEEFFDVGYTADKPDILENDLKSAFDYSKAVDKKVMESGTEKFSIFVDLGVTKKKRFRTVWQKDNPQSIPRIITGHREDE